MKDSIIRSREINLKSRNSNNGIENTSFNSGEIHVNNENNYTFKQNCNSLQKNFRNKNYLRLNKEDYHKKLNNRTFGHINIPKLIDQLKVSTELNIKKNTTPNNEIINHEKKLLLNRILNQKKPSVNNSLSKAERTMYKDKNKNSFSSKIVKQIRDTNISYYKHYMNETKTVEFLSSNKITSSGKNNKLKEPFNSIERFNSRPQSKKVQHFNESCFDTKNNSLIAEKSMLIKKVLEEFNHVHNHKNAVNNKTLCEKQKYLLYTINSIENKVDCIIKENESLKEIIKTKLDCFEQMKDQLNNLSLMIETLMRNNKLSNEKLCNNNSTIRNPKLTKKNVGISSKRMHSLNSNESEMRIPEEDRNLYSKNRNTEENSSISICSEFSIENSREITNPRKISNRSIKAKSSQESEKGVAFEVLQNNNKIVELSHKNSIRDNFTRKQSICFVNQLEVTYKNDNNSHIINFENNSFKKDSEGFPLTLKDPSITQSNYNSISTKTNTKIHHEITGKQLHESNAKIDCKIWKKECDNNL